MRIKSSIPVVIILILGTLTLTFANGVRKRIKFAKGRNSTVISNAVLREDIDQYIVGARAGQQMKVTITSILICLHPCYKVNSTSPRPGLKTPKSCLDKVSTARGSGWVGPDARG